MKQSAAPTRARWAVAVEFWNGSRIEGTSATDVLARWGWIAGQWSADGAPFTADRMKHVALQRTLALAPTAAVSWSDDDEEFLDRLDDAGVLRVIRRG